ncbi:MAG: flippase [Verrucomicrobia bacterium]|nr:flippase [Verrucomicrobiota bacterium]
MLHTLFARPGAQVAARNFGWLVADRCARLVLTLGVGLWVARYLGPERLGRLSYVVALVTLANFLPQLGLDAVLRREWLRSPAGAAEWLASAWLLRMGAGLAAGAGLLVVAGGGWGLSPDEARLLAVLVVLMLQPAWFLPELWLQTQLNARAAAMVQTGALAVASVARVGLIAGGAGLTAFAWVLVGEMVLGAGGFYWAARRAGMPRMWGGATGTTARRLVREAWPLALASLAVVIYMKIDEVMLRRLAGAEAVGIYAAAARLSEVWYFVPTAIASSVLPALLRAREAGGETYRRRQQEYYDLSAALAYGLSVPVAWLAPLIVQLAYGPVFAGAAPILAVHIWSSVFVFLGVARGQWLVNEGLQTFYLGTTAAGAVVNVGLNLVLIPRWGGLGAAWATVIAYGVAAWLSTYLHPAARPTAARLTRALLIPLRGWRYLRRT